LGFLAIGEFIHAYSRKRNKKLPSRLCFCFAIDPFIPAFHQTFKQHQIGFGNDLYKNPESVGLLVDLLLRKICSFNPFRLQEFTESSFPSILEIIFFSNPHPERCLSQFLPTQQRFPYGK